MSEPMDSLRLLGALAAALALVSRVMTVGKDLREALDVLGLGRDRAPVVFYELWTLGFLAAAAGGLLWGLVWRRSIGGDEQEPHGACAALWPVLTLLPVLLALSFLNHKYRLLSWPEHVPLQAVWLVGAVAGSLVFYDLPLAGMKGFRAFFVARSPYPEFWLVFIWSALLTLPGFLLVFGYRVWRGMPATPANVWDVVVKPTGTVVIMTSLAVVMFLLAYTDRLKFEQARGVVAAIFMRTAIFLSLFIAINAGREHRP